MNAQIQTDFVSRKSPSERREETRHDLKLRVSYPRRNAFFHEYTRNISRGGMFIATRSPFEPGTELTFELQVPGEERLLEIKGEVRWRVLPHEVAASKRNFAELECGMGIAFIFETPQEKIAFEDRVLTMLEAELGVSAARQLVEHSRRAD